MKARLLTVAGGIAALGALGMIPAHAGTGTCSPSSYDSTGATQSDPVAAGPNVYTSGDPTTATGSVYVEGSHGYIGAGGSPSSGAIISGYQTETGVNGSTTVGASPGVCVGAAGTTAP